MIVSDPYWRILTQTSGSLIIHINRFVRVHYYTSGQFNFLHLHVWYTCLCPSFCLSSIPSLLLLHLFPAGGSLYMTLVQLKAEKGVFLPPLFAQGPGSRSLWSPERQLNKGELNCAEQNETRCFFKNTLYLYGILTSSLLNEYNILPYVSNSVLAQPFNYVINQSVVSV